MARITEPQVSTNTAFKTNANNFIENQNVVAGKFFQGNNKTINANSVAQEVTVGSDHCKYSTISAALASITDNAKTKPYVISIAPGVYNASIGTNKEYVTFDGSKASFLAEIDAQPNSNGKIGYSSINSGLNLYADMASPSDVSTWEADELRSEEAPGVSSAGGILNLVCKYINHRTTNINDDGAAYGYRVGLGLGTLNAMTNLIGIDAASGYTTTGIITRGGTQFHTLNTMLRMGAGTHVGWYANDDSHSASVLCNHIGCEIPIDWLGGENILTANYINSLGTATIRANAGSQNYISCNFWKGDLSIGAGSTLYANINRHDGILTDAGGAGAIVGRIGTKFFGEHSFSGNVQRFGSFFSAEDNALAAEAVFDTGYRRFVGEVHVFDDFSNAHAISYVKFDTFGSVIKPEAPINFTNAAGQDTGSSINVYYEGGILKVKNKLASTVNVTIDCSNLKSASS